MMRRTERLKLIKQIEDLRKSKIIVYITGDRNPFNTNIAGDAVDYLLDHILSIKKEFTSEKRKIDLFLYSRGGDVSVPWRIVSMIREFCDEFSVLIPYKAHSAATMIAIGADEIIMSPKAELGPIDPTIHRRGQAIQTSTPPEISVEDVDSYISFISERVGIKDESCLASLTLELAKNVSPLVLGKINRLHSHIRLVGKKLLESRRDGLSGEEIKSIVQKLTRDMYSHGHAISRKEAKKMKLPVVEDEKVESLIWDLFKIYQEDLEMVNHKNPEEDIYNNNSNEVKYEEIPSALIESTNKLHIFKITTIFKNKFQIPPQLNLNMNFQLPPTLDPKTLGPNSQKILQDIFNIAQQTIKKFVEQEIQKVSQIIGMDAKVFGKWEEKNI